MRELDPCTCGRSPREVSMDEPHALHAIRCCKCPSMVVVAKTRRGASNKWSRLMREIRALGTSEDER